MAVSHYFGRYTGILAGVLVAAACGGGGGDGAGSTTPPPAPPSRLVFVANSDSSDNTISIYTLDATSGALSRHPSSPYNGALGLNPASVAVSPSGRFAYVANLGTRDVSALAVNPSNAAITLVDTTPYPVATPPQHVAVDPLGRFAYVALSSDQVAAFTINTTTGALTEIAGGAGQAPGTSPRHLAIDPSGLFAYVANGGNSNSVTMYAIDQGTGALTLIQETPLTWTTTNPPLPASIAVDSLGRFLYVANSGNDTVSAFKLDPNTGAPSEIGGSPITVLRGPNSIAVEPSGRFAYIANLLSSEIAILGIDPTTGLPALIAAVPLTAGSNPQSLIVDPSGNFVYVTLSVVNLEGFRINPTTGALTRLNESPFPTGFSPRGVIATGPIQ